jgi:hypothetical protein
MPTILANGQEIQLDDPRAFCLIPGPGIRVDVPAFTEINSRLTIAYIEGLDDRKWQHISKGPLFTELFNDVFQNEVQLPDTVAELVKMDFGVQHLAGLIIMSFEAICERGENVYWRTPEDHLHPRQTYHLMTMLEKFRRLGGAKKA